MMSEKYGKCGVMKKQMTMPEHNPLSNDFLIIHLG